MHTFCEIDELSRLWGKLFGQVLELVECKVAQKGTTRPTRSNRFHYLAPELITQMQVTLDELQRETRRYIEGAATHG